MKTRIYAAPAVKGWMLGQRHIRWSSINPTLANTSCLLDTGGGGAEVMVSTAAFHARVRGSVPGLGGLKETKNVSSPSTCKSQYCGKPPWPKGSVLGLRPPGLEFRVLCLENSVISFISPSSWGFPGLVQPICAQRWPKARFISFLLDTGWYDGIRLGQL